MNTELKLKNMGVLGGYNGFSYMCYILSHFSPEDAVRLGMDRILTAVAGEYRVSKKTVTNNLTLLAHRSWEAGRIGRIFYWDSVPTMKEFVFALVLIAGKGV